MRKIQASQIKETIKNLLIKANYDLPKDIEKAIKNGLKQEKSKIGKEILSEIEKNAEIAREERLPICQDTGLAIIFIDVGQEVKIIGGDLNENINKAVKEAYEEGYLRKSTVNHPFERNNTKDNLPPIIHYKIVSGSKIKIKVMAKGGGAENTSIIKMFNPTASQQDIKEFIVDHVKKAGANACPPLIIGIGIGGNFEKSALLAKESLSRKIGSRNSNKKIAKLEKEILEAVNKTNIGPMGLGGKTTAFDVHIETAPCHIASLPVAINIECHAHRVQEAVI